MFKRHLIYAVVLMLSCSRYPREVETALKLAGNNRAELEQVLSHYSKPADSMKLHAACFLIGNMPGHYSYDKKMLEAYYAETDPILESELPQHEQIELLKKITSNYSSSRIKKEYDLHVITAAYLIRNIDLAFDIWQNGEWARHVDFDDFCEYLLPYKVLDLQPMDAWRDSLSQRFGEGLKDIHYNQLYKNLTYRACQIVQINLQDQVHPSFVEKSIFSVPFRSAFNMYRIPVGTCADFSFLTTCVMRSHGIPVAFDYTPQWPFRASGHSWNVLLASNGKEMMFGGLDEERLGVPHKIENKMSKVYRRTYASNKEILDLQSEMGHIPPAFINPFIKDVSDKYLLTSTIDIETLSGNRRTDKYAYLSVFDNKTWVPVAFGRRKRNRVTFIDIGRDILYMPVYCTEDGLENFNYPFSLDLSGNIRYIIPDTNNVTDIILLRKYPVFTATYTMTMRMVGGRIQASNLPDFTRATTLYVFDEWTASGNIVIRDTASYRYWRYLAPNNSYGNIAELMFYDEADSVRLQGNVIGSEELSDDDFYSRKAVFDGTPFSYFQSLDPDNAWVGLDFGTPKQIHRITYLPRSDDNNIRIGDEYELFYWGTSGWISLGRQVATDIQIKYTGVPSNALFWLRDLSRGQEERIFTYENGQQIWW
jgi:hypothetical protein